MGEGRKAAQRHYPDMAAADARLEPRNGILVPQYAIQWDRVRAACDVGRAC